MFLALVLATAMFWAIGAGYVNFKARQALVQRLAEFAERHPEMSEQAKTLASCTGSWRAAIADCGKDLFAVHGEDVLTTLFVMQTEGAFDDR